jgi:hypothetical protein
MPGRQMSQTLKRRRAWRGLFKTSGRWIMRQLNRNLLGRRSSRSKADKGDKE